MTKQLSLTLALLFTIVLVAQDNKNLDLFEADSTWLKEIIKFPFGFAPQIEFKGYEDLRFAKNWSQPEGSEFFTYAFIWNINLHKLPTSQLIEENIKLYYDGLMEAVNKDEKFLVPETKVNFKRIVSNKRFPKFKGSIQVHDSFFTRKTIQLNATAEALYCKISKRYLLYFKVSTHKMGSKTWKKFNKLKLKEEYCKI
jgi:hypothetical protein